MNSTFRLMRRAPARVAASVAAIALALAAMGVFAIPGVAEQSLRSIAADDRMSHLVVNTTPVDPAVIAEIAALDGVEAVEGQRRITVPHGDGGLRVIGRPLDADAAIDRLRVTDGRLPLTDGEALVSPGVAAVGDELPGPGGALTVVGVGDTTATADRAVAYVLPPTAADLVGGDGVNRLVLRLDDPTRANLDTTIGDVRRLIGDEGAALTAVPLGLVDGAHPIETDIAEVSFMIGALGVVAGIVALILLASTASAVVTERTRDAAVMRAIGGTRSAVRRDLRRLAVTIGALGTLLGIPLGVAVSNYIARMVLEDFAGITPDIGADGIVVAASAVFAIGGARLVAGRAARRVCRVDLPTALRDRDAVPFGARWTHRVGARLTGGGLGAVAGRALVRRPGRALAIGAQFAGAVTALVTVASLSTSIADFNGAELEAYRWERQTQPADLVHPFPLERVGERGSEVAVTAFGMVDDWEIEVVGVDPSTMMVDRSVVEGRWLSETPDGRAGGPAPAVLAERFARQEGHEIGDELTVELASGSATYEVVGLHAVRSVAVFAPADVVADDLGVPGFGNTVWSIGDAAPPRVDGVVTTTVTADQLLAEDQLARDVILGIFWAIGVIVVSVSALGVATTVSMGLFERRHELAVLRATGARGRHVAAVIAAELAGLALVGWIVGAVAGNAGAEAIVGFFATSNAVELGYTFAAVSVPAAAAGLAGFVAVLALMGARQTQRRSLEATLRAA